MIPQPAPPPGRPRRRASFRARLTLLVALAVGLAVALGAFGSYVAVHHQLFSQVDSSLDSQRDDLFRPVADGSYRLQPAALSTTNKAILVGPDGQVIEGVSPSSDFPVSAAARRAAADTNSGDETYTTVTVGGTPYRELAFSLGPITLGGPLGVPQASYPSAALVVAHPLTDIDRTLSDLRLILFLVGLSGIALAVGLGYAAARAMIRPVERLTAAAEHVAVTQDLAARIDEEGDDELARLGHSFNAMLGALETSRLQQAQLVADAGHELRTPLTSLRTNIEFLMKAPDIPTPDRDELLADVKAQLEELTTLVGDLVDLARDEEQLSEPLDVPFAPIVERAVERARRRAPSLNFEVSLDPGDVRAQPALLERAVLNVLDNAAKWSPPEGRIEVSLRRGTTWVLQVRDHGPGIAPEDLPKVFDRFYRASNARSLPGSGLGLAIVRQAVEQHGGSVQVQLPPGGGTLVRIELPVVTPLAWPAPPWPPPPGDEPELEVTPIGALQPPAEGPLPPGPTPPGPTPAGPTPPGPGETVPIPPPPVRSSSDR